MGTSSTYEYSNGKLVRVALESAGPFRDAESEASQFASHGGESIKPTPSRGLELTVRQHGSRIVFHNDSAATMLIQLTSDQGLPLETLQVLPGGSAVSSMLDPGLVMWTAQSANGRLSGSVIGR